MLYSVIKSNPKSMSLVQSYGRQNKSVVYLLVPPWSWSWHTPGTGRSSRRLSCLMEALCVMYVESGGLMGRLCKHSVRGSTHVYPLIHQSHAETVKDTEAQLHSTHNGIGPVASLSNASGAQHTKQWNEKANIGCLISVACITKQKLESRFPEREKSCLILLFFNLQANYYIPDWSSGNWSSGGCSYTELLCLTELLCHQENVWNCSPFFNCWVEPKCS